MQSAASPPQPYQPYQPNEEESGGRRFGQPQSTGLTFCLNITHNLTQICLGAVIFSALFVANVTILSNTLAQHIILCTTGYFILMAQAILLLSPFGWANNLKFDNKKMIHLGMNLVGSILAIAGTSIRIADIGFALNSGHGICGFLAMLLTILSLIGGLLTLIFPKQMNNKVSKIMHSIIGAATLCLAFIALIIAFHNFHRILFGPRVANFSIVLAVFALVGTMLMAMVKTVKRLLNN